MKISIFKKRTGREVQVIQEGDKDERLAVIEHPAGQPNSTKHDEVVKVAESLVYDCPSCRRRIIKPMLTPSGKRRTRLSCDDCGVEVVYHASENCWRAEYVITKVQGINFPGKL